MDISSQRTYEFSDRTTAVRAFSALPWISNRAGSPKWSMSLKKELGEERNVKEDAFVYRIDRENIITRVSENWESFARDNSWTGRDNPDNVVGHLIWDFIEGIETKYLYREVFQRVRLGKPVGPIPFRCDSPQERRLLELFLTPLPGGQIEITSTIVRTESRDPVRLLDKEVSRSSQRVRICSVCKKIAISQNTWVEIEEGLAQLRIFEADEIPGLTHGLCPACYQLVMADLDEPGPSNNREST